MDLTQALHIETFSMRPVLQARGRPVRDLYFVEGHWTPLAHTIAATILARKLAARLHAPTVHCPLPSSVRIRILAAGIDGLPAKDGTVLQAAGGLVKSLPRTVTCSPAGTTTSVVWDGRNAANVPVPAGTYTIEVAATDRAGNAGAVSRGTVVAQ